MTARFKSYIMGGQSFELEGRYGARARNYDGFSAGAVLRGRALGVAASSKPSELAVHETIADFIPSPAIYPHTADNGRIRRTAHLQAARAGSTIYGHRRTVADSS